ncbi:MAG: TolC family protein [Planctomycetia bacterium]|nr:TolC family protein [Planctomycetia bacterium]
MAQSPRAEEIRRPILPEQRRMAIRDPSCLPPSRLPPVAAPATVSQPRDDIQGNKLSLDEAIRIALANSEVIRVLGGSSGQTQYDPAITNTEIDRNRAAFDPTLSIENQFFQRKPPSAFIDPHDPNRVLIDGVRTNEYNMGLGLSKPTISGGTVGLGVDTNPSRSAVTGLPLNPETSSAVDLSATQPLLQGAGARVNLAPVEIARIDTERSFFQLKDAVQDMVRGVIEAYWSLVLARTDLWVREQQIVQGTWAHGLAVGRLQVGLGNRAEEAQARSALAEFKAARITAQANVLAREDVLRNILGLPPSMPMRIVPVSPPSSERVPVDWQAIVAVASERRPDLVELKLVIEADQQRALVAENDALPSVDLNGLYRWNGLEGRSPDHQIVSSVPGQFTEWQLGVNFSVPLGLRKARAALRAQELVILRDRANLEQGLHNAIHELAANYRNLDQFYDQYEAYQKARAAAQDNLEAQAATWGTGQNIYLNVLQAITTWGNSVNSEAQSLTLYNTELATLERQTGTILETHGIRFAEERFCAIGPLGRMFPGRHYPRDMRAGPNTNQYKETAEPAEQAFHLDESLRVRRPKSGAYTSPSPAEMPTNQLRVVPPERIPAPTPAPPPGQ